jgi:type II secretory pathway pseudopilin PulG
MRVIRTRDQSGAAGRRHRFAQRRKRGTTLIELVLYIGIATVIMTFSLGLLREEQVRRERTALAAELQQVTTALQTYVSANYETIRDELLRDTPAGSDLIRAYGMQDVVAQGYLPAIFAQTGTTPKSFVDSLQYGFVVRAVRRSQSNYEAGAFPPTQTRTVDLIEPGKDPIEFERTLVDNTFADDPKTKDVVEDEEIDLEALLVTISSDPCRIVPAAHGPRIVSQSETNAAGYVTGLGTGKKEPDCSAEVKSNLAWKGIGPSETALMATGPYGGWRLPLQPYADLVLTAAEFPDVAGQVFNGKAAVQAGRFVSLLALPKRPPLSESAKIAQQGDSAMRCAGVPTNSAKELECKQSDLMFASLTFEDPWDSNNDNVDDTFPGLLNVNTIQMAPPSDSDGDDIDDVFPGLLNVSTLAMAAPPADGTAQISNILSLSCATGNTVPTEPDRFTVDCPETKMQGLVVTSDAAFDSNVTVASQLVVGPTSSTGASSASAEETTTGEIILNGENLAGKFMTRQSHTFSGEPFLTVNKPGCPTGSGLNPDISIMPVAFNLPELPEDTTQDLLGVNTEFTTVGETWQVKLKLLVKTVDNDEIEEGEAITQTLTNPTGSKVVVLTGCSP